jgi:hypothetical protein
MYSVLLPNIGGNNSVLLPNIGGNPRDIDGFLAQYKTAYCFIALPGHALPPCMIGIMHDLRKELEMQTHH